MRCSLLLSACIPCVVLGMVSPLALSFGQPVGIGSSQGSHREQTDDFYGLYYGEWNDHESDPIALVISSDGKAIAPRPNDPDAPTQPGLHIDRRHFQFESSRFSPRGFSFRTANMDGTEFSFRGRFGRESVDSMPGVPYLLGVLVETRNGRVVRTKKVHFAHSVVL